MSSITRDLARFALETRWEDLPPSIVKETKLVLMEHFGTALGALTTDKGKMNAAFGRRLGGPAESTILGTPDKVSCSTAAFANGELMLTLDYSDIIAGGHDGAYVIPTVLAIGETVGASGKDFILATALGLEISARLARAVGRHNVTPEAVRRARSRGRGLTGNAYSNFGAAGGAGRLLGLGEEKMLHALGIAGHLCMVLSYSRWGVSGHRYMAKYGVPGWQSTGAVAAVTLAEMGYTGDVEVLDDPERGFCYYVGYKNWYPEDVTLDLGKSWCFNIRLHYKPYPCCGAFHSALDCLLDIMDHKHLVPEEIESVSVHAGPDSPSPFAASKVVESISGAQFNPYYNLAVAAHGITRGVEWVDPDTMKDPKILRFMDKISWQGHSNYFDELERDPITNLARAEVTARGEITTVERKYRRGTAGTEAMRTDQEIIDKFKHNAVRILTEDKIDAAADTLMNLEKVDNISQLFRHLTL